MLITTCETTEAAPEYLTQLPEKDYSKLIESINMTRIAEHMRFFSSTGTRASGYPGNWLAAQYIRNQFKSYGLVNVTSHEFEVTDCIDHGTNITFLSTGEVVELYSMRPNFIVPSTTPPEGVSGRLVYVEDADLEDLEGKEVQGKIAIVDWNAGSKWVGLYERGAKAVIFLNPDPLYEFSPPIHHDIGPEDLLTTTFMENLPLKFPRFYAPENMKNVLLDHLGEEVLVRSSTYWETVKTWNIYGFVKGTEWPDQSILLVAHYDSYSDAPRYAPGAQEASSIATLLEMARYFQNQKPKHTIIFAACGGHHQNLEGFVRFIGDFLDPKLNDLGWLIKYNILFAVQIGLDTGSDELLWLPCAEGGYHGYRTVFWQGESGEEAQFTWLMEDFFRSVYDDVNTVRPQGKTYRAYYFKYRNIRSGFHLDVGTYFNWFTKLFDIEPLSGFRFGPYSHFPLPSVFTTAYYNKFLHRPFDEYSYVNLKNLQSQVELIFCSLNSFLEADWTNDLKEPELHGMIRAWLKNKQANVAAWRDDLSRGQTGPGSMGNWGLNVTGIVGVWNDSIGWYSPVPNALVVYDGGGGDVGNYHRTLYDTPTWFRRITIADENGRYLFEGGMGQGWAYGEFRGYSISAWVTDSSTGDVLYAPDMGIHKYGVPESVSWKTGSIPDFGILAVFRCSQIVFQVYHPKSLGAPTLPTGETRPAQIVFKNEKFEDIMSHGLWSGDLYLLAFPPEERIKVMVYSVIERYPFMMYLNSTLDIPEGYGFALKPGEQRYIPIHQAASDMHIWAMTNLGKLTTVLTEKEILSLYQDLIETGDILEQAEDAIRNGQYFRYAVLSKHSLDMALEAYFYYGTKSEGVAVTVPFFSLLAVPFTILAEALFFKLIGKKKVLSLVVMFGFLVTSLYLLHPGFSIASNPIMNIIGFSMLILLVPIVGIMFMRVSRFLTSVKIKYLGEHEIDISRMRGSFIPSFKMGVENMKKRKLRSSLTFISILLLVLSISCFTSISSMTVTSVGLTGTDPAYQGIMIRKDRWGEGGFSMGSGIVDYLQAKYGDIAYIAPRAWHYMFGLIRESTDPIGNFGYKVRSTTTGKTTSVKTLWGLTPQEKYALELDSFLLEGRWFMDSEDSKCVCIITQEIAEQGFKMGEKVTIAGSNFTIIGVISNGIRFFSDLDKELGISPIKFDVAEAVNPWNYHVAPHYYVIIPYKILLTMGGRIASVAIKPYDASQVPAIAEEMFNDINIHRIYYGFGDSIRSLSQSLSLTVFGLQSQIIPMVLVVLSLLNMLLSSIFERRREIHTFSSVGLSPTHIAVQFLAEAVSYAIVGSIIGYILSLTVMKYAGLYLGITLDYSSGNVILVVGICMLAVLASSIFPAITAARLVTPSLERTWRPPTKPVGNTWDVPLPFTIGSDEEATRQINFLKEFLMEHESSDAPMFSVKTYSDEQVREDETIIKRINAEMALAPYGMGLRQHAAIALIRGSHEKLWTSNVTMTRISGLTEDWERAAQQFIDAVRKQMLLWKSLSTKETSS